MVNLPRLSRPGQKIGQTQRADRYAEQFNATLVSLAPGGEVVTQELDKEALDRDTVNRATSELNMIKMALMGGSDRVLSSCGDARVVEEVKRRLDPEELAKVTFSYFDVPIPSTTVQL